MIKASEARNMMATATPQQMPVHVYLRWIESKITRKAGMDGRNILTGNLWENMSNPVPNADSCKKLGEELMAAGYEVAFDNNGILNKVMW